jgi:hypothetical protein
MLNLLDPATNMPFPTPLPRSAMPFVGDPQLAPSQQNWVNFFTSKVIQAQTNAQVAQMLGNRFVGTPGGGAAFGVPAYNPYLAQYQAQAQMAQMQAQIQATQARSRAKTAVAVAKVVGGLATTFLGGGAGSGFTNNGF